MGRQNYRGTTQIKACGAYAHKANTLPTDNGVCRVPLPLTVHRTCSEGKCNTRHARSLSALSILSVYAFSCALTSSSHLPLYYIIYLSHLQAFFRIFFTKYATILKNKAHALTMECSEKTISVLF